MRAFKLTAPPPADLPETDVTKLVCEFMARNGWMPERRHVGKFTPLRVAYKAIELAFAGKLAAAKSIINKEILTQGETGDPDFLFVHPCYAACYVEMKATGQQPRAEQIRAIWRLQQLGYKATFANDLETFKQWYMENIVPHPTRS